MTFHSKGIIRKFGNAKMSVNRELKKTSQGRQRQRQWRQNYKTSYTRQKAMGICEIKLTFVPSPALV